MKTAISIPDATFERAERRARELGMSRSQFYANAVERWLSSDEHTRLTEQIDAALSVAGAGEDLAFLSRAAADLSATPYAG